MTATISMGASPSGHTHSLVGNPFINRDFTWSQKINRSWNQVADSYLCKCGEMDPLERFLFDDDDHVMTTDRLYYNRTTRKLVAENDSPNWWSGYSREIPTDMTEDEIIEQYTKIGFKITSKNAVGVTLQKMDHSESSKHLYHKDDRKAFNYRI
mmetsp:Transcript_3243/g.4670  ORF Transcript_3243/g.4670 Transcript_3243/m.4670 type:complete len:154 (+) Transcript_3243:49-510(+)